MEPKPNIIHLPPEAYPIPPPSHLVMRYGPRFCFVHCVGAVVNVSKGYWNVFKMVDTHNPARFDIHFLSTPRGMMYAVTETGATIDGYGRKHANLKKTEVVSIIKALVQEG